LPQKHRSCGIVTGLECPGLASFLLTVRSIRTSAIFSHIEKLTNLVSHHILVIMLAVYTLVLATVPAQGKQTVIYNQTSSTETPAFELGADSGGTLYGLSNGPQGLMQTGRCAD